WTLWGLLTNQADKSTTILPHTTPNFTPFSRRRPNRKVRQGNLSSEPSLPDRHRRNPISMPTQWGGPPPVRATPNPTMLRTPRNSMSNSQERERTPSSGTLGSAAEHMSDTEYEESPMATLQFDFHEDREEPSVASRAAMLAEKRELSPDDVCDFGEGDENRYTRFALKVKLMDVVQNTVTDVDFSMRRMAELIPERKTCFKVDPDDVIIAALSGSQSLSQLHGAWTVLTKRMAAALKFAEKYAKEFHERKLLSSPRSTPETLHDNLQKIEDGQSKLKYMVTNFPRHSENLTQEQRSNLLEKDDWDVLDTPNWMKNLLSEPVFEEPTSERNVRPTAPPRDDVPTVNELGLQEVSEDEQDNGLPKRTHLKQKGRVSFGSPGPLIVQTALTPQTPHGLLGAGTPFKSQSGFLRGLDGEGPPRLPPARARVESSSVTPNPLFGMATPGIQLGSQGERLLNDSPWPETPSQPPRTTSWTSYQFSSDRTEPAIPTSRNGPPAAPPPTSTTHLVKGSQPSRNSSESPSTLSSPDIPPVNPFGGGGGRIRWRWRIRGWWRR
ncbi:hypothetical protein CVT26_004312, partial [Gymnopilus dilepis]